MISKTAFIVGLVVIGIMSLMSEAPLPAGFSAWDKLEHLSAYTMLGFLGAMSWPVRPRLIFVSLTLFGGGLEILQGFIPPREPEWGDALANALGAAVGILFALFLLGMARRYMARAPRPQ